MRNHPDKYLSKNDILTMFERIGEICCKNGDQYEIAIYGGSAIMLSFDYRQTTMDIDFIPVVGASKEISDMANFVATTLNLPQDILRDDVSVFVSDTAKYDAFGEYPKGIGSLRVFTATPEYIFAMKMLSMRNSIETQDLRDVWELADICGVNNIDDAINILVDFYPENRISKRNRLILEDVFLAKEKTEIIHLKLDGKK